MTTETPLNCRVGRAVASPDAQAERERCLQIVRDFQFVYERRRVEGYGKGGYMMVDAEASRKKLMELIQG